MAHIVTSPDKIEQELRRIWEGLAKERKMRASLFNLIVLSHHTSPARATYIQNIVQKTIEKFPCRILFLSLDPTPSQKQIQTSVSVVAPQGEKSPFACDQISIEASAEDFERIPLLLLPHLLPDLPIYLLFAEDPSLPHPLFAPLSRLSQRVIFDSEIAEDLPRFASALLTLKKQESFDLADLNWARTEPWRHLITSLFDTPERKQDLSQLASLSFTYNNKKSDFFTHPQVPSLYLASWLKSRLRPPSPLSVTFSSRETSTLPTGALLRFELTTHSQRRYLCERSPQEETAVAIQLSSPTLCERPYRYILSKTAIGHSLAHEITTQGTSPHYLDMLQELVRK